MSEPESHDLAEPFDPIEHLGPHDGDHAEPLDHLEGLFDEPMVDHLDEPVEPIVHHEPFAASAPIPPRPVVGSKPVAKPMHAALGRPRSTGVPSIVTALGTALVMLGGAYGLSMMVPKPEAPAASTPPPAATSTATPAPATGDSKVLATKVDGLASSVDGLSKRLDDVQKSMEAMPKAAPLPDLKPIEAKLADVAKKVESVPAADTKTLEDSIAKTSASLADLSAKLDAMAAKSAEMEKTMATGKAALAALMAKVEAEPSKPAPTTATPTTPAPAAGTDAEYGKAVDLFKKMQYAQAKDRLCLN